jgi:hypothetical protein
MDVQFEETKDEKATLKLTLTGKAEDLIHVLVHGLPYEDLLTIKGAFDVECKRRGLPVE